MLITPTPELCEEQRFEEVGNPGALPPEADAHLLPVVGLGASAGSIRALQEFFDSVKCDSGLAFVVVMHLAPDFDSQLPSVVQHHTKMPVVAVTGETKVEANHVYVIAPGHHLAMDDGTLRLEPLQNGFGKRVAVDLFFRSLAASHRSRAVAVVLSGLDFDGGIGIKRIKENGGVTVAQAPEEAQHEGMPRAAINTGRVDWVLPVAQITSRLEDFARNEPKIHLPPVFDEESAQRHFALVPTLSDLLSSSISTETGMRLFAVGTRGIPFAVRALEVPSANRTRAVARPRSGRAG